MAFITFFCINYNFTVLKKFGVSLTCKAVLAGSWNFTHISLLTNIHAKKVCRCRPEKNKFTRWQLQTCADCAQKLWQASSLEGNLLYIKTLVVGLHCKIL